MNAVSLNHPHALLSVSPRSASASGAFLPLLRQLRQGALQTLRCRWTCLAGLSVLSACAHEPVIRVPPRFADDARLVPPDTVLTLSDGARIPARIWSPLGQQPPRAMILALHGFNDSRDAWEMSASRFTTQGIAILAPDQRGFGAAPNRGGWAGSARMVEDAREEVAVLRARYPGVPVYLMGESMGGAVALLLMTSPHAPAIAGTILLAPAVWALGLGADVPLRVLAALDPNGRLSGREVPVHVVASDNMRALVRLYFDPLTLHTTGVKAFRGLVDLMSHAADAAPKLRGPTLLVYGDRDQLVPPGVMAPIWRTLPSFVRRDVIPGGHHLLLRDRAGGRVVEDLISWIRDPDLPLPSGGDVNAATWQATDGAQPSLSGGSSEEPFPLLPSRLDELVAP